MASRGKIFFSTVLSFLCKNTPLSTLFRVLKVLLFNTSAKKYYFPHSYSVLEGILTLEPVVWRFFMDFELSLHKKFRDTFKLLLKTPFESGLGVSRSAEVEKFLKIIKVFEPKITISSVFSGRLGQRTWRIRVQGRKPIQAIQQKRWRRRSRLSSTLLCHAVFNYVNNTVPSLTVTFHTAAPLCHSL